MTWLIIGLSYFMSRIISRWIQKAHDFPYRWSSSIGCCPSGCVTRYGQHHICHWCPDLTAGAYRAWVLWYGSSKNFAQSFPTSSGWARYTVWRATRMGINWYVVRWKPSKICRCNIIEPMLSTDDRLMFGFIDNIWYQLQVFRSSFFNFVFSGTFYPCSMICREMLYFEI